MPYFALTCLDKADSLAVRMATREAHLAFAKTRPETRLGGALLDDNGQMIGSLLIIEAEDKAGAQAFSDADPYKAAGLFASVEIRPWRLAIGQIA